MNMKLYLIVEGKKIFFPSTHLMIKAMVALIKEDVSFICSRPDLEAIASRSSQKGIR